MVKNLPAKEGDARGAGLISGLGRSPGGGNGNPLQYSCWKSHQQRSQAGYSPGGCKESDITEHTQTRTEMIVEKRGTEDPVHKEAATGPVILEDGVISPHIHTHKEKCNASQLANGQWHVD